MYFRSVSWVLTGSAAERVDTVRPPAETRRFPDRGDALLPASESFAVGTSPCLVLSDPNHLYLRLLATYLGDKAAILALREADGIEAACQARPWALGDPKPRQRFVDQFHASCDRHRVGLVRSLHAMQRVNPVARRNTACLGDPGQLRDNVRLVRSEILLAAALRRPAEGEAALVLHPGHAWQDDAAATTSNISHVLQLCADLAAEQRVRLTVETEPVSPWGECVGQDMSRLGQIVEEVNEWCERRGLPPAAAITMDIEHSVIAAWGREDKVLEDIEGYGHMIDYVHVVRPRDIFDQVPPPKLLPQGERVGFLRRHFFRPVSANAHMSLAPSGEDPRTERIILAALERTNWQRIGVFNFEALPTWYYTPSSWTRGATAREQLAGIRRLRELVSGAA